MEQFLRRTDGRKNEDERKVTKRKNKETKWERARERENLDIFLDRMKAKEADEDLNVEDKNRARDN